MGFGIRELLMLIGALVFVAIAFDGVRRFQHNRKTQLKVRVDRKSHAQLAQEYDEVQEALSAELPNGGARVKNYGEKVAPTFNEPLDILMTASKAKSIKIDNEADEAFDVEETEDTSAIEEDLNQVAHALEMPAAKPQRDLFHHTEESERVSLKEKVRDLPEVVLSINVIAKGEDEIAGEDLLEAVLAFGLRYGEMNIFHRHEQSNGQGAIIFSMANALNPGTFNIENLPQQNIKGVTFFMRLSQISKRVFVLELMLDIARRLADQLNAELRDDTHSVLSSQTVSHYKNRIQEYERQHLGQVLRGHGD